MTEDEGHGWIWDPMNYLEWTEAVLQAVVTGKPANATWYGTPQLTNDLGLEDDRSAVEALNAALGDLEEIGMVELVSGGYDVRFTQNTRLFRDGVPLTSAWPEILKTHLDGQQMAFLRGLIELSMSERERYAVPQHVQVRAVFEHLGWPTDDIDPFYELARSLRQLNCVHHYALETGGGIHLRPTYFGVVRATQEAQTEQQQRLVALVDEWETSTVDFKRELSLNTPKQKAEFVRDVLALANTKASGQRSLIIGFDPVTHELTHPVGSVISLERLEQILHAYCEPPPEVRYREVRHNTGIVGLVEVLRDPAKLPYVPSREVAHIKKGQIFVRHGTSVEEPTKRERDNLLREGEEARRRA